MIDFHKWSYHLWSW